MHHFILIVTDENIRLISTYGGQEGVIDITRDRKDFIQLFGQVFDGKAEDKLDMYRELFGIELDSLDMKDSTLSYSFIAV